MQPDDDKTREVTVLSKGTVIGHYRIVQKIGAGGMGEVYLAEDTELNRKVALKFLPLHLNQDADCRTRFKREAQAAAKLNHPSIVTIHEVSEFGGRPYFAMENVEGQTIRDYGKGKELPLSRIIELGIQICEGLAKAHSAGIVHRDIKPSNILIDQDGRAKIVDFGLASVHGSEQLTKTGSTLGTVGYMSPEQVRGEHVDLRTDIFSLGVVLYELITGRQPFKGDNDTATSRNIIDHEPEPLARYKSGIKAELQRAIDKALDKNVTTRYQHADDLAADLKRLIFDSQQTGHHLSPKPVKSPLRFIVGAAIVIIAAVLAFFFFPRQRSTQTETAGAAPMIAVLPFDNLGNPEDEYFADGMTEEITSRLAGIKGLGVISRTSAMQYKKSGKSIGQIGKELGVSYLLEGSVRWAKSGGQTKVRITPQLIRVSDDRHMWADNYERELMEVFTVQAEIASRIVDQLGLTLLEPNREKLAVKPTTNERAYEYYLKGLGYRQSNQTYPVMITYAAYFDTAVMLDPAFALAHAERSIAYSMLSGMPSQEKKALAREAAEKALQLNPKLPQGHLALGFYYNAVELDYDQAMREFEIAKSELPNDPELLSNIAFVQMRQGKFSEAQSNYRRAAELDPVTARRHFDLAICLSYTRSFDEEEAAIDRAIAIDPSSGIYRTQKLSYYATRYGDLDKMAQYARVALKQVDTLWFFADNYQLFIRRLSDLPIDSLFARWRRAARPALNTYDYYGRMPYIYRCRGDSALVHAYADSARQSLEAVIKDQPVDYHLVAPLGLALAFLGECDRAVEMGHRGMDLLSVDKCHW